MKRYVQNLSPEDRKTWRRWQAGWLGFYVVLIASLFGISFLIAQKADIELVEHTEPVQRRAAERPVPAPTSPADSVETARR
jgi:hypothetical protein